MIRFTLILSGVALLELAVIVFLICLLARKRKQFNKVDLDAEVQIRKHRDNMEKKKRAYSERLNNAETTNDMVDVYNGFVSDLTD